MILYLRHSAQSKRTSGFARDQLAVRNLRRHFGGMVIEDLTPAMVWAYIEKRRAEVQPATINRELAVLGAALNHARRKLGWKIDNPIAGCRLKEPEGRLRWLTHEEAERLIAAAEREPSAPHLADFIRLALHTGMRRGEILSLEWSRVDLQAGVIYLEGHHTKTGKRRVIPLNASARAALLSRARFRARHCPDSPWVFCHEDGTPIGSIKRSFATACRRAGIVDFRIHDLRHTCAAWLVSAGVPLSAVRDLLGHSSVTMTERYAHLAPDTVRAAVSVLDESRSSHVIPRFGFKDGR